jgi:F-type H+-transporting ATPase subunit gamma
MNVDEIRRQRESVETIHNIVHALRAVAAGRIQGAQRAVAAAERYHAVVIRSLSTVPVDTVSSRSRSVRDHRTGLLVFTSEQPLCGALTQNIVDVAERRRQELSTHNQVLLMVVGRRGIRQFTLRGSTPDIIEPGTTSLAGLRDLVRRLAGTLAARYASGELGEVRVVYSRYVSVSEQVPTEERILPPDLDALRQDALHEHRDYAHYMPSQDLLEGLIAEYVFIALYRIAAQMLTSEQAARLVAMDAATRSAERMLDALLAKENRARQEEVTNGVLELIGARFASDSTGRAKASLRQVRVNSLAADSRRE